MNNKKGGRMITRMVRAETKTLKRFSRVCKKKDLIMSHVVTKLIKNWLTKVGVK